ncbi:MAG: DUF3078 domain-containing protein [Bacteroidales bacterium]|nr:DUF3078 domain-containing protein [Bacteroidales bacterium]
MNQFSQLLILIFITSSLHLSASEINKTDTTGTFNEITDIELRIKQITEDVKESDSLVAVGLQDTLLVPVSISTDSLKIDEIVRLPKEESVFTPAVIKTSLDSFYARKDNGTIQLPDHEFPYEVYISSMSFRDTMLYNPLFVPVVFTGRIEPLDSFPFYSEEEDKLKGTLISSDKTFEPLLEKQAFTDRVRRFYYTEHLSDIKLSTSELSGLRQTASDRDVSEKFNPFKELLSSQTSYSLERPDIVGTTIDRVYWVKTGDHSLQFSQNYLSPNWHRGGTSNLNINSNHVIDINYQKDKVKFNNRLEWRLSVYNAPDDSLRDYRIGNDMLRYYGDFGLDAFLKSWSYSTNLEAKTQMFKSFQSNKDELRSAFLSPLYVNAGIGMKYHLDKRSKSVRHRRTRLSISISPISINYRYVGNNEVDRGRYGIPEGDKSLLDKGSTLTSNMTFDFTKYITLETRLKYFTNYSKVEAELENTLTMSLSRLFSTKLYLNLRFDDSVPSHEDYKYLQVNEVLSFGLNYKW